jgi:hypothetical protein
LGLEEALGIVELAKATELLRDASAWVQESFHARIQLESQVERLESDKARIFRDMTENSARGM